MVDLMIKLLSGVIAIISLALYFIFNMYMSANDDKVKAEQSLEMTVVALKEIKTDFSNQVSENGALNNKLGKITTERDFANQKLNGYRDREYVVSKKPKAIERLANRATSSMFNNICAASGGDCQNKTTNSKPDSANKD